ncbi:MAG: lamin tail domain-containing protein [Bacteroidetes bacterium]|nr:lamin tail domain-containing protein [Bacteroidota bacterium]MDA0903492.1 lamin tail domain-containing protein [Bacteroidota bacterium]MDA1241923.1 lamin tail domain-containing protein [Bacteroidota bacterium]
MKRFRLSIPVLALGMLICQGFQTASVQAQCDEVFISEYIEGWGNNKAVEIYNPTNAIIDMSNYRLERYSNGATAAADNQKVDLSGTLHPDSVLVYVLDKQDPDGVDFEAPVWDELAAAADVWLCPVYDENNAMYFNGNDALVLRNTCTNTVVDVFGKVGEDPGTTGWAEMTQNHTLTRLPAVTSGDVNAIDEFLVVDQWSGVLWSSDSLNYTLDIVFSTLGSHTCDCGDSVPSGSPDDCVVSGVDVHAPASVELFPNPALGDVLTVRSASTIRGIILYNLSGQIVQSSKVAELTMVELNLAGVEAGAYLLEVVHSNGTTETRRLVRN